MIGKQKHSTQIPVRIAPWTFRATLPKIRDMIEKSASEKVVEVKPIRVKTGMASAGKKVIRRPWTKAPAMQPLTPPSALPKTPAVAPQKK